MSARIHIRPNAFRSFHDAAAASPETEGIAQPAGRPARAKLRGAILTLILLPNRRQRRGAFHQLSMSGGLLHIENPLDEKIAVELVFHLGENTIREKVVPMLPIWATRGWLQPFSFASLSDQGKFSLEQSLRPFLASLAK